MVICFTLDNDTWGRFALGGLVNTVGESQCELRTSWPPMNLEPPTHLEPSWRRGSNLEPVHLLAGPQLVPTRTRAIVSNPTKELIG